MRVLNCWLFDPWYPIPGAGHDKLVRVCSAEYERRIADSEAAAVNV